jgi:hypothetical protein
MQELAERGLAILMISSELPEILGMSDRIGVMRSGTIRGILPREEATQASLVALAIDPGAGDRSRVINPYNGAGGSGGAKPPGLR